MPNFSELGSSHAIATALASLVEGINRGLDQRYQRELQEKRLGMEEKSLDVRNALAENSALRTQAEVEKRRADVAINEAELGLKKMRTALEAVEQGRKEKETAIHEKKERREAGAEAASVEATHRGQFLDFEKRITDKDKELTKISNELRKREEDLNYLVKKSAPESEKTPTLKQVETLRKQKEGLETSLTELRNQQESVAQKIRPVKRVSPPSLTQPPSPMEGLTNVHTNMINSLMNAQTEEELRGLLRSFNVKDPTANALIIQAGKQRLNQIRTGTK